MPSFSIALSGLQADSTALNTVGNNLANLNTTAFKKQDTKFEDLFYQSIGGNGSGEELQTGVGVRVSGTTSDFTHGAVAPAGGSTNMALQGDGFFVVQRGQVQSLTRAGNFQLDKSGNLITQEGENVMGFAATNGAVTTTGNLVPLAVPLNGNTVAKATSEFSVSGNLDATATPGQSFNTSVTMYDSLGKSHVTSVSFTKQAVNAAAMPPVVANTWNYNVALPPADFTGAATNATGSLVFSAAGVLQTPAANPTGISFAGMADGASALTFDWHLYDTAGTPSIAQSASPSTATASAQDGYASGVYEKFTVDQTGLITASFSNGKTQVLGQVAVASVADAEGLTREGGNNYTVSAASGQASFAGGGVGSRGTIADSALEGSNVDISTEFADLIVAQRAFEANSKTLTTFDSVTQQAIAMIR